MLQNYNTYKILRLFFDKPSKSFQLRELSRLSKIALPSVINHVDKLSDADFVSKEKKHTYASYTANRTSEKFKLYKKLDLVVRIHDSGLVDYLVKEFQPNSIVLFGSASRGEDVENSDVDIFVEAKEQEINLSNFEKEIKRKINLLFELRATSLNKELLSNIANGIILYGYLRVLK